METAHNHTVDILALSVSERVRYYKRELDLVTPPKSFREQLLSNVYRCLLEQCENHQHTAAV
ncbi:hypothetical protein HUU62_26435 [Rhodoferax sp. 4810]|uniref:Uncharacterized protein n=1 Tax=Thiospirillum jenense TaxID=1653858 RepID=A0A839HKU2_9GAMM|nr:hypothetical protein [Thiospirillum jenense]MBB1077941.1 hypothetical protein [Rhodoferax jenense]MBB1127376.1 hypothetical protein [Thiospirillum jenense]